MDKKSEEKTVKKSEKKSEKKVDKKVDKKKEKPTHKEIFLEEPEVSLVDRMGSLAPALMALGGAVAYTRFPIVQSFVNSSVAQLLASLTSPESGEKSKKPEKKSVPHGGVDKRLNNREPGVGHRPPQGHEGRGQGPHPVH